MSFGGSSAGPTSMRSVTIAAIVYPFLLAGVALVLLGAIPSPLSDALTSDPSSGTLVAAALGAALGIASGLLLARFAFARRLWVIGLAWAAVFSEATAVRFPLSAGGDGSIPVLGDMAPIGIVLPLTLAMGLLVARRRGLSDWLLVVPGLVALGTLGLMVLLFTGGQPGASIATMVLGGYLIAAHLASYVWFVAALLVRGRGASGMVAWALRAVIAIQGLALIAYGALSATSLSSDASRYPLLGDVTIQVLVFSAMALLGAVGLALIVWSVSSAHEGSQAEA